MMQALTIEDAEGADRGAILACPVYDYAAQKWNDSADHAHYETDDGPLLFCGADRITCQKNHPEQWR